MSSSKDGTHFPATDRPLNSCILCIEKLYIKYIKMNEKDVKINEKEISVFKMNVEFDDDDDDSL